MPPSALFARVLSLPPELAASLLAFLPASAPGSSTDPVSLSDASRAQRAFGTAGRIGAELDALLNQWTACYLNEYRLASERETLIGILRTLSNTKEPERGVRSNDPGPTGQDSLPPVPPTATGRRLFTQTQSRSINAGLATQGIGTQRVKKKGVPKDCVMALSLIDATLTRIRSRQSSLASRISASLANLSTLHAESTLLASFHRSIALHSPSAERELLCNVLDALVARVGEILAVPPVTLGAAEAEAWDAASSFAEHVEHVVAAVSVAAAAARPALPPVPVIPVVPVIPQQAAQEVFQQPSQPKQRKRKRRSSASSAPKSSQRSIDELSAVPSSLAKAIESPRIARLLDGLNTPSGLPRERSTPSSPAIPGGQPRVMSSGPSLVPAAVIEEDSETDDEKPVSRRPRTSGIVVPPALVERPPRPPDPESSQDRDREKRDSSQDGPSAGSSLSPSVLIPRTSGVLRASGRVSVSVAPSFERPLPGGRVSLSMSESNSGVGSGAGCSGPGAAAGTGSGTGSSNLHPPSSGIRSGMSITSDDLRALKAILDDTLSSFSPMDVDKEDRQDGWSASSESSQSAKRTSASHSQESGKRVPLSEKPNNSNSNSNSNPNGNEEPSMFERLLGWVGISGSAGRKDKREDSGGGDDVYYSLVGEQC